MMKFLLLAGYAAIALFFFGLLSGAAWNDDGEFPLFLFSALWPISIAVLALFSIVATLYGLGHIIGEWLSDKLDEL